MKYLLFLLVPLFVNVACAQTKETRQLSSFHKLEAGSSFNVVIEKGNENSARLDLSGVEPEKVITEVRGDVLKINLEKGNYRNVRGTVYVTYTEDLEAISGSGSGSLTCKSDFSASNFAMSNSGSGNLDCEGIKADHFSFSLSGSGNVEVASVETEDFNLSMSGSGNLKVGNGSATRISIDKSGSGDIHASDVKSDQVSVAMSGSGNVDLYVNETIEGSISGSSNINYKGNATVSNMRISGSGEVNKQ